MEKNGTDEATVGETINDTVDEVVDDVKREVEKNKTAYISAGSSLMIVLLIIFIY